MKETEGVQMNDMKSESSISYKLSPMEFSARLSKYDVISFDLFDTLIFRPLCCPLEMCLGNPYMQIVVELLAKKGKRMVITSDHDPGEEQITSLLESCGYPKFGAFYISGERGATKSRGDIYDLVRSCEGCEKSFVHVGDDMNSDVENARKHGFAAEYYENIHDAGEKYRPHDMSSVTGSVYRGLVNAHIHNGLMKYSCAYESGYIYMGLPVTGYCQFIHEYVKTHNADEILLLPGIEGILLKAYQILYPQEDGIWERQYKNVTLDTGEMKEIQDGVLEFVGQWHRQAEKCEELKHISMKDACAPLTNMFRQ